MSFVFVLIDHMSYVTSLTSKVDLVWDKGGLFCRGTMYANMRG